MCNEKYHILKFQQKLHPTVFEIVCLYTHIRNFNSQKNKFNLVEIEFIFFMTQMAMIKFFTKPFQYDIILFGVRIFIRTKIFIGGWTDEIFYKGNAFLLTSPIYEYTNISHPNLSHE